MTRKESIMATKRRLHRIRKGWDCPHCKMHFGWSKQFAAHVTDCAKERDRKSKP